MARNAYWLILGFGGLLVAGGCASSKEESGKSSAVERRPRPPAEEVVRSRPAPTPQGPSETQALNEEAKPEAVIHDPEVKPAAAEAPAKEGAPQRRTAFFRLDANAPATIPKVVLSKSHEALCKVKVGDQLPVIQLPMVGGSDKKKLTDLLGKTATVVLFWKADRRMSKEALSDMGPDIAELFGKQGVAVVGVAVNESAASAKAALDKAGAKFTNLLDADGKAFAQVGSVRLPRVFLVDPTGKILWFDIEYSQTTRRELHQALRAVTAESASADGKKE
jgi:peroxiredoxin